ncbi:MAG: ImmA/IrrE family metallo-endopeptidase [Pyrinomonadaceae bacterium]
MRRIYKFYGIQIDLWPYRLKNLRGAIMMDSLGASIMLAKSLPTDPLIFTMAHELKHFLTDKELASTYCHTENMGDPIEIGAEIFAAELIFPEQDFSAGLKNYGVKKGECTPEDIVRLKHETKTTLSYQGLCKHAERLRFADKEVFDNVKFVKLEEKMYGVPIYKQDWFKKRRGR